jgi:hypothetical protein
MNGKLQESTQYLKACSDLEIETFALYKTLSKKINQPESSFILCLAYDSLKCARTLQRILDYFDPIEIENASSKKTNAELAGTISDFTRRISRTNNVNYEMTCEILKELSTLEDQLSEVYNKYKESTSLRILSDEFSTLETNTTNFKRLFENYVDQKQKHKEIILELILAIEAKEASRLRNATPLIKYSNPDAWIRESTFHNFANPPLDS